MANSMMHWNKKQVLAVGIKTTGPVHQEGQICDLSIIPLDSNFNIRRDTILVDIKIQVSKYFGKWDQHNKNALPREHAADLVENWIRDKIDLKANKYGNQARVILLGTTLA